MCGIFAAYRQPEVEDFKSKALQYSKLIRHRGPDWSGNVVQNSTILCHERLAIVGLDSGAQPIVSPDGNFTLAVNGEIYNHIQLREQFPDYKFKSLSDCEPIIPLFTKYDIDAPKHLDGMFAWVLYDKKNDRIVAARDPIGITTLYMGKSSKSPKTRYFASELKCLIEECDEIFAFPPGHVYDSNTDEITRYFQPSWWDASKVPEQHVDFKKVRETLELAVRKRLMAEVPYGVLLSGGLDSSLIASIASRETKKAAQASFNPEGIDANKELSGVDDKGSLHSTGVFNQLHSFAIGLPGAPDLLAAEKVAHFIGTIHHSHTFTLEEGLDALDDVIYHLETYDVTTIRASTPMYLLSRKIKAQGVKMVLSGEGSDEIFGGYLYFANAPSAKEFHEECVKRVKNLHYADCLRANKSTMAWGLEARVPFLDKQFLEVCMNINPEDKLIQPGKIEKYILRKAFDTSDEPDVKPYLPEEILWRQKEQFSDGVGYSWIDGLKDTAEKMVSDEEFAHPKPEWGDDIPTTKEAYWYRCKFDKMFNGSKAAASTVMRWIPKAEWGCHADPSGRYAATHDHKVAQ
ncbi:asparagine synthetase [glutamine-hydrolyzing] 2 [Candida albicans P57072]|uniref:asparagine synthase (glutamine-hydrolyzing) n=2 Tax=Candida albicans TaxID=5476 RepID=A0A1D8PIB2_CANAL|nr:asparagine synthase (glutamine-hydrolyzing) 2 [Candida albicans SC5314]KGQ95895.1 asparagine synthetase [glutamine-hydrolyzing] 2 [Candida albicans P37005]KGR00495.1 asparagine synthetase [glutamine-hydrolyzing] 2 [Candida albicans GC75]KGR11748.1 asparagine synthetase [glutamine-hydrolyzing] 2 [Candida albicans P57072]KGR13880.1 asparagine synthetase [glutamine-hydrolyzing] 2 [Candida albicans P78048]KGR20718.1 asparagine synthetase [glutamine-hydrolyzing] 2 [Candida albicans P37037]KGU11|eukprot:XP_712583.1 asparagine synthase (glutamine-hydrolyzing) 2 [Candida albicans SC5314]